MVESEHRPVLLAEVLSVLITERDGVYVDATFGRGGHSRGLLGCLSPAAGLLALDRDPQAVAAGQLLAGEDPRFVIEQAPFSRLGEILSRRGLSGRVQGVLLDLGVSSPQLDDPARGFSFAQDGPLDMRMNPAAGESAGDWLQRARAEEIAEVLWRYGEERYARRIARAIVTARADRPLEGTRRLAEIVARANPAWEPGKHPATRSFQAIRIFINRELEELGSCLGQVVEVLALGGRLAVISFHSLEDRIVKRFMRAEAQGERFPPGVPVTQAQCRPRLRLLGKSLRPSSEEVAANPRARSAVLRVAERVA